MSRLSIYFTSDTHAYLYPTNFASRKPLPMGLLGMRFPKDGNTLVIDGGDTIQGSPMTYYAHAYGVELPIARALAAEVVTVPAFEPISDEAYERALALLRRCKRAIVTDFPVAGGNRRLADLVDAARQLGILQD